MVLDERAKRSCGVLYLPKTYQSDPSPVPLKMAPSLGVQIRRSLFSDIQNYSHDNVRIRVEYGYLAQAGSVPSQLVAVLTPK